MNKERVTVTGESFTSVLTIVFVVLKLCGVIQWSWLWVLSPTWISVALWIIVVIIIWLWVKMTK